MTRGIDQVRALERRLEGLDNELARVQGRIGELEGSYAADEGDVPALEARVGAMEKVQLAWGGGPASHEIRWLEEEKEILLAAIRYIELWEPGDDVPPIGQESMFDRLQSAVLAYQALVTKHDPPEEEVDDE